MEDSTLVLTMPAAVVVRTARCILEPVLRRGIKKSTDPYKGQVYVGFDLVGSGTIDYLLSCNGNTSNSSISLYRPSGVSSPDTATNSVNLG